MEVSIIRVEKVRKAVSWLIIGVFGFVIAAVFAQSTSLKIESVVINNGVTDEIGTTVGQDLSVKVTISNFGGNATNITVGVDIYNSTSLVESLSNQTATIFGDEVRGFTFSRANVNWPTGYYTAEAKLYNQSGVLLFSKNASFKVVNITPVYYRLEHQDLAPGDVATFLQNISNTGTVPTNVTVEGRIKYYTNPADTTTLKYSFTAGTPVTQTIAASTSDILRLAWNVPGELAACEYTNSTNYRVFSEISYGYGGIVWINYISSFNLSYVEVDTKKYSTGDEPYHSGLGEYELAPGGVIKGGVELLNRGKYPTVIHEVRAWVEDGSGNRIYDLIPSLPPSKLNNDGSAYLDVIISGHNSTCDNLSNDTIAHKGALDFPFEGVLPATLSLNENYKVVFAIDYGVPRNKIAGRPWNIMWNSSFYLVKAEVVNVSTARSEVAGSTQVTLPIVAVVKNAGSNEIESASAFVEIFNPSGKEVLNYSASIQNLAGGAKTTISYPWDVPSNAELGTYTVNARVHYATGVYHNLSTTFNVVSLLPSISTSPVAPYESTNVTIRMQNPGPTNATLELLGAKLVANRTVDLGTLANRVIPAGSTEPLNFTYYFNPAGMSNGTFPVEVNVTYGGLSFNKSSNITLLPVGIKSFSLPSYGITNTSFNASVVLHNIAGSAVNVSLNLTVNGSSTNYTTVSVPANSTLTHNIPVNITSPGVYTIALYANYSSLPGRLSRSGSIAIYDTGAELSISSSDITLSPASPRQGDRVTISARVSNTGSIDANNVTVEFLVDSGSYKNKTVSISANSSTNVDFSWSAAAGAHTLTIRIDPSNTFAEKNESDNQASVSISVAAAPSAALAAGPGGPRAASPFTEGLNVVTSSALLQVIKEKRLEGKRFYSAEASLLPAVAALGLPPVPESIKRDLRIEPLKGDKYAIAAELALKKYLYLTYPYTVIVARGDLAVDAIAAVAYARSNRIPVLLTEPEELPEATLNAIKKFKPRRIMIVGGEAAISSQVEERLSQIARVERIAGKTRYETAVKLAKLSKGYDTIVVTDGEAPSSDAVFLASAYRAPVVYIKGDEIPEVTADFISEHRLTPGFRPVRLLLTGVNASLRDELLSLILSPHLSGELSVVVHNSDDDRLYVEVLVGSFSKGRFINPGSSHTYKPFKLKPGNYTLRLRWLDPDRLGFNYLEERVQVSPAKRTEARLEVPEIK